MAKQQKTNTAPPKGTRDFLAADVHRREYVTRIIRETYEQHGFEPLETPAFERLDTLLGKYGEEGDQLVFKILHRGQNLVTGIREAAAHIAEPGKVITGRSGETAPSAEKLLADMGLRYDLTVPLARVYAEYQGKLPPVLKRYQIQPVWRADTPGKGRFREFYQCDVDVVGSNELVVEAEVAGAVAQAMQRLGFTDFAIKVNHRQLLRAMIEAAGIPAAAEGPALVALDKLDKVGWEAVEAEWSAKGITGGAQLRRMIEGLRAHASRVPGGTPAQVAGAGASAAKASSGTPAQIEGAGASAANESSTPAQAGAGASAASLGLSELARVPGLEVLAEHPLAQRALGELQQLFALSSVTPAGGHLELDPTLARGLGYYTGCVFEIAVKDLAGSLGGGGRYDGLIGMFLGRDVPACGFSIGLERILVVMEERGMFPASTGGMNAIIAATAEDALPRALELAYTLRARDLRVELLSKVEKPGRARKAADDRNVPFAILVAANEAPIVWSKKEPEVIDRRIEPVALADYIASLS